MNKTELTKVVADKAELTQKDAATATQAVLDAITTALANEEKVQILGFGTFEVRERSARTG
ncbi:HU family DNA-binding protein, partial [Bacillus thuringiensis]